MTAENKTEKSESIVNGDYAMKARVIKSMVMTWGAIRIDVLTEMGGSMTRQEVIDAVLDDLSTYGGDKEAIKHFFSLEVADQNMIAYEAFPERNYGW